MSKMLTAADVAANRREGETLMDTKRRLEQEYGITRPQPLNADTLGEIIPAGRLFISQHIGRAEGDGSTFEMLCGLGGNPMIKCEETGKTFALSWQDVLKLAVARGVTQP